MAERKTCSFCLTNCVKYTCPRCNVQYCSSACYKSEAHSECSESFYKDCFMEGLKDLENSRTVDKSKVMEMLQRNHSESETYEEDPHLDLSERLQGLDLDKDDELWEVLTPFERKQFNDMVRDGRISLMLKVWEPWWTQERTKVQEMNSGNTDSEAYKENESMPPQIKSDVMDIKDLLRSKEPSYQVVHTVVNVLYAYGYLCRFYNGSHHDIPLQFVSDMYALCGSFHKEVYESVSEAIVSCHTRLQTSLNCKVLVMSHDFSVAVVNDVVRIICGGPKLCHPKSVHYVMAALSDLHHILREAKKQILKDTKDEESSNAEKFSQARCIGKKVVFACQKKVEFLLSYLKSYGSNLKDCVPELETLFCKLSSDLEGHNVVKEMVEGTKDRTVLQSTTVGTKLIEEIKVDKTSED